MITFFKREDALTYLLVLGIALRLFVYFTLPPTGSEAQADVLQFMLEKGRLPLTSELPAAGQPPLYYLLAGLFAYFGGPEAARVLSLLLSVGGLYLLYRLCKERLPEVLLRHGSFLLAVVLPSYVLGSLDVSSQALTIFLGTLLLWVLSQYIHKPTQTHEIALAVVLGLGILTQGTFLALGPLLLLVAGLALWKVDAAARLIFFRLLLFSVIALTIGSYKYLENYYIEGRLFIPDPLQTEAPGTFWAQLRAFYTAFWRLQVPAEGTLGKYLGPVVYLLALLPTLLMLLGFVLKSVSVGRFLTKLKKSNRVYFAKRLEEGTWLILLLLLLLSPAWIGPAWTGPASLVLISGGSGLVSPILALAFFPVMYLLYLGFRFLHESAAALLHIGYFIWLGLAGLYLLHYVVLVF